MRSNQVQRESQVSKKREQLSGKYGKWLEDSGRPQFRDSSFNLTNYEAFVKKAMVMNEQLKEKGNIPVSEKCSAMIRRDVSIPDRTQIYLDLTLCFVYFWVDFMHFELVYS